eukprot:5257402-Karenia_brevis.AAC.1
MSRDEWRALETAGFMYDPRNVSRWRHPRPGPINMWEDVYCKILGDSWRSLTADRKLWRSIACSVAWMRFDSLLRKSSKLVSCSPDFDCASALTEH